MAYKKTPSVQTVQEMSLYAQQPCSFYLKLNGEYIGHYHFHKRFFRKKREYSLKNGAFDGIL